LQEVCRLAAVTTGATGAVVWRAGPQGVSLLAQHGLHPAELPAASPLIALSRHEDAAFTDLTGDTRFSTDELVWGPWAFRSLCSTCLFGGLQMCQAVMWVFSASRRHLHSAELDALVQVADCLLKLDFEAGRSGNEFVADRESGLLTRNALTVYLTHALARHERAPQQFSLLHVEAEQPAGHLRDIAYKLHLALRACDLIARAGSTSFAIALFDVAEHDVEAICNRLRAELCRAPSGAARVSIGALVVDGEFSDAWDLLDQAKDLCERASRPEGNGLLLGYAK
jgi:GGDEF domain-containing protein